MPDLQDRLVQQSLEDNEIEVLIDNVTISDLEKYYKPQEALLIYLMAMGKGTPQVAQEMNLPMASVTRLLSDILKRTHSYSIVELLNKREWEVPPQQIRRPVW